MPAFDQLDLTKQKLKAGSPLHPGSLNSVVDLSLIKMPKQTRLNFSKQPATASKRQRDSDDETDEQNERPPQRSKTTASSSKSLRNAGKQTSPTESSGNTKTTTPNIKSPTPKPTSSTSHITLSYAKSSLFASPPQTLLCHACNTQGSWGAGIALAFKKSYPSAFKTYASHCSKWPGNSLLGTTLLIPPQQKSPLKAEREAQHWIGCLFTSEKKGKGKGSKESILEATGEAVEDLVRKVRDVNGGGGDGADGKAKAGTREGDRIAEVRMCKINSGLFGVPWEATREVIEGVEVGAGDLEEIAVYSLD
jgi:ADP-ribose 1''-phosphate phosphatase